MVASAWVERNGELLLNGDSTSVLQDEKVPEWMVVRVAQHECIYYY